MKILKKGMLVNKVSILLFLALIGCNNYDKTTNNRTNSKQQSEIVSESLSYEFEFNGCKTGKHTFESIADYCNGLQDEALNNSCAHEMRMKLYNNKCSSQSNAEKKPSLPPPPIHSSNPPNNIENSLPNIIYVVAKFEETPNSISVNDEDGSTYTFFGATVHRAVFSVKLNDQLNLGKASTHSFIAPKMNDCILHDYSFNYIGMFNSTFNFGAMEKKGVTSCQKFMKAIETDGLHMQFTDVPLLNGKGAKIKFVDLIITNP